MYTFYEAVRSKEHGRTSTNMYLQHKWDMENLANHRYKVKTAKPCIANEAPLTFTHLFVRPKKLQLELERYSTIQRHNRLLLERLARIQREGAWIDDKNIRQSRSLNTWKRQQEMIQLTHNNQIMIARLEDVKTQYNRSKLEDEYLMYQKYKANIQKWPPNWKEVQQHLNRVKADIFKKVFDSKYQTEIYRKLRKRAVEKWTKEKEKHAAAKVKKDAEEAIEEERQKQNVKEEQKIASKERKKALEKWLKTSDKWKSARDKRLELIAKKEKNKVEEAEDKKRKIQDREIKRRQREKEKLEKWIQTKKEEKKKLEQQEKEKKIKEKLKKEKLRKERKRHTLKEQANKKSTESMGFDVESDDREDDYAERKDRLALMHEEIQEIVSELIQNTLSAEQDVPDRRALENEEIHEIISELIQKSLSTEQDVSDFTFSVSDVSDYKDLSDKESISSHEDMTEKQVGSEEETPTKDTANIEMPPTTVPDDETISDNESSIAEEIIPDDESSITEENISDEELLTTDKTTSDEESP